VRHRVAKHVNADFEGRPMDLADIAYRYRLKLTREFGEAIIPGRCGQLYAIGPDKLGCLVMLQSVRRWRSMRGRLLAIGCRVVQDGDTEGTVLVDPGDHSQVQMAMKAIKAKRQRRLSADQRLASVARLRHAVETTTKNRGCF
jgi:hypothetical protein